MTDDILRALERLEARGYVHADGIRWPGTSSQLQAWLDELVAEIDSAVPDVGPVDSVRSARYN